MGDFCRCDENVVDGPPHPAEGSTTHQDPARRYSPSDTDPYPRRPREIVCELLYFLGQEIRTRAHIELCRNSSSDSGAYVRAYILRTRPLLTALRGRNRRLHIKTAYALGLFPAIGRVSMSHIQNWAVAMQLPDYAAQVERRTLVAEIVPNLTRHLLAAHDVEIAEAYLRKADAMRSIVENLDFVTNYSSSSSIGHSVQVLSENDGVQTGDSRQKLVDMYRGAVTMAAMSQYVTGPATIDRIKECCELLVQSAAERGQSRREGLERLAQALHSNAFPRASLEETGAHAVQVPAHKDTEQDDTESDVLRQAAVCEVESAVFGVPTTLAEDGTGNALDRVKTEPVGPDAVKTTAAEEALRSSPVPSCLPSTGKKNRPASSRAPVSQRRTRSKIAIDTSATKLVQNFTRPATSTSAPSQPGRERKAQTSNVKALRAPPVDKLAQNQSSGVKTRRNTEARSASLAARTEHSDAGGVTGNPASSTGTGETNGDNAPAPSTSRKQGQVKKRKRESRPERRPESSKPRRLSAGPTRAPSARLKAMSRADRRK